MFWPFGKKESAEKPAETEEAPAEGPQCSVCGRPGADKSFAGQKFHKQCYRKARKAAKRMI